MLESEILILVRISVHQKINIGAETHLSKNLNIRITLLQCLVNKDALSIEHLIIELIAVVS